MDTRFWMAKRRFPIYNPQDIPIPAYAPVTFSWDNGSVGVPSPWQQDTTIRHRQLVFPVAGGTSETGLWNTLYAINGPFDIPPLGYGEASIDYPLPLLVDGNSFPIPNAANPSAPTPGNWDQFTRAYAPDAEGAPPCGPVDWQTLGGKAAFPPATFLSPPFPLWYAIAWDVEADGSESRERMIVIPTHPYDTYPYGGSTTFSLGGLQTVNPGTPLNLLGSQTIQASGLFTINVFCNVEIDTPGTAATVNLAYVPKTPPPSNPYIASASRQTPKFTVGDADDLSYYPNDKDVVTYSIYGYETISFSWPQYMTAGDKIYIDLTVSQTCKVAVGSGTLWFAKIANNPLTGRPNFN